MITGVQQQDIIDEMARDTNRNNALGNELRQWVRCWYLPTVLTDTNLMNPLLKDRFVIATVPSLNNVGGNHRIVIEMHWDKDDTLYTIHDPNEGREGVKVYGHKPLRSWSELTIVDYCWTPWTSFATSLRNQRPQILGDVVVSPMGDAAIKSLERLNDAGRHF